MRCICSVQHCEPCPAYSGIFAELFALEIQDVVLGAIGLVQDQAQELNRFAFLVVHDLARPALIGGMLQNLRKRNWGQTTVFRFKRSNLSKNRGLSAIL